MLNPTYYSTLLGVILTIVYGILVFVSMIRKKLFFAIKIRMSLLIVQCIIFFFNIVFCILMEMPVTGDLYCFLISIVLTILELLNLKFGKKLENNDDADENRSK